MNPNIIEGPYLSDLLEQSDVLRAVRALELTIPAPRMESFSLRPQAGK